MKLAQKTVVVTGAGSGIGRELTRQLLAGGARVAAIDNNPDSLRETQKLTGATDDRLRGFLLDITDKSAVADLPDQVVRHFGGVDALINNAGIIQPFKPVNDLSVADIERVMNVNFYGTVYLTKAFLPLLLQRPDAHIVNISSMGGFIPFPGQTIYGAAKAAVKLFTEGLHAELRDTAVRITVVHPGAIATNITENSGLGKPKAEAGSPKTAMTLSATKAADQIIRGIETNRYRVMVGRDATLLDLFYRLSPERASRFIATRMKKTLNLMNQ